MNARGSALRGIILVLFGLTADCNVCAGKYYCYSEEINAERQFAGGSATSVYRVNQDGRLLTYGARIEVNMASLTRQVSQQIILALPTPRSSLSDAQLRFTKGSGGYTGEFALRLSFIRGGNVVLRSVVRSRLRDHASEWKLVRPLSATAEYPEIACVSSNSKNSVITIAVAKFIRPSEAAPVDLNPAPPDDIFGCSL
jgi:hypothetical protein